jgi:hypothetical protein
VLGVLVQAEQGQSKGRARAEQGQSKNSDTYNEA